MTKKSTKADRTDRGRFSAKRKTRAVLRLLRGEGLDALSREPGVAAATLEGGPGAGHPPRPRQRRYER